MLSYQTIGSADDTPLIFLHGLGAGASQITSAFTDLHGHHIIAPDMPGHGASQDYSPDNLCFDYFADQVIKLMDQKGITSCNIGGLSMGSGITLNLTLRYPERVQKIILLRPSWLHQKQPEHLKLVALVGQWIEELGTETAQEKLLTNTDFQDLQKENPPVAHSITALFARPTTPVSTAVLYKMWNDNPFSDLAQLSTLSNSTLVLTTSRDELHPQSTADVIATHIPNAQKVELPPRYHDPEAYSVALNSTAKQFLAE